MLRRTLLLPLIVGCLFGQSPFPAFEAEALSGRKLAIPAAVQGHAALIIIGFARIGPSLHGVGETA